MSRDLEQSFPELRGGRYEITSPPEPGYNCIAWAAGDTARWWEPDGFDLYHWPEGVRRQYTLEAYAEAFTSLGFEVCDDPGLESGWEKVAIYAKDDGSPTHAARQLANGTWTSKLGNLEDINHPGLDQVSGRDYGRPVLFLRRRDVGLTSLPTEANP